MRAPIRFHRPLRSLVTSLAIGLLAVGVSCHADVDNQAHGSETTIYYVDGKTGSDLATGRTPTTAFKTIAKAAAAIPKGTAAAGWTVSVKGYSDYVYRERPIPSGWSRRGTAAAPITFVATGWSSGTTASYVKPIVSGADEAPAAGQSWTASGTAGVWTTPWATKPFAYGEVAGSLKTALFQDASTWLWEQPSLDALAARAKLGLGGYWYDAGAGKIYASAVGSPASGGTDPARYKIAVIMRNAFLFMGTLDVAYVTVRGFDVRNSANGIAFVKGTDYGTATDNVLTGNLLMGIATSGRLTTSGPDPSVGNVIARNTGSYNTLQMIKIDEGTQNTSVCDNSASKNGLQGIKVQGTPSGTPLVGPTTDITVCRNRLFDNTYNPTGSIYNNTSGLTVANGAQRVTVSDNKIYGNEVGIHLVQESADRAAMNGLKLQRNDVNHNRRFGLNLYDGAQGASSGSGTLSSTNDVYWANGTGIMASRGTANKVITRATVYDNVADGVRVGEAGNTAASLTVSSSIVADNGGYGVWLVTGNSAKLSYVAFSANGSGSVKGAPTQTGTNTKVPGFLSTVATSTTFLKISSSSFQYTAGPGATPIGARY